MYPNETAAAYRIESRSREALFEEFRPLARSVARRVCRRADEDVEQVALLGLMKAIDRFDSDLGTGFAAYAAVTIRGEVLHYLRDQTGVVRIPRWAYDLVVAARSTTVEMLAQNGQHPRPDQVAAHLGVDPARLSEALVAQEACVACSFDAAADGEGGEPQSPGLATEDPEMNRAEVRVALTQLLNLIDRPLRNVIWMRYYEGLSQRETAHRCGVSAVQICRLEHRALDTLRALWTADTG